MYIGATSITSFFWCLTPRQYQSALAKFPVSLLAFSGFNCLSKRDFLLPEAELFAVLGGHGCSKRDHSRTRSFCELFISSKHASADSELCFHRPTFVECPCQNNGIWWVIGKESFFRVMKERRVIISSFSCLPRKSFNFCRFFSSE